MNEIVRSGYQRSPLHIASRGILRRRLISKHKARLEAHSRSTYCGDFKSIAEHSVASNFIALCASHQTNRNNIVTP